MRFNSSVKYALIAVVYVAKNYQDGLVLASRVSKEYGIPLEFLLRIMGMLVKAGVLKSKRGPRGGFSLACNPKNISMLQIIEAIDGTLMMRLNTAKETHLPSFSIKMEGIFKKATDKVRKVYGKAKLSDLL